MDLITGYINKFHSKTFNVLIVLLVYSSVIYFFSFITADPDLWGHIMFGKEIFTSKAIPRVDIYSYTANGMEWINHEWLSELFIYGVYKILGSPGLLISKLLIGLAIIFILTRISSYRRRDPLIYGIIFVMSISVMSPGFMTRPQVITFLFTCMFLFVFHLYLEQEKDLLWLLPIIMLLWVNSHGGFIIGAGIFPAVVLCETITNILKGTGYHHLRRMIFWMILTEVAIFINPYGYRLLIFLYETLSVPRSISEWNPITIFDLSYIRLKALSLLFLISLLIERENHRYWEIIIILFAMVNAFYHERHTPIFAIVAAPFLAEKLSVLISKIKAFEKLNTITSYMIINIVVILLIFYQLSNAASKYIKSGFNIIVDPAIYPIRAVLFLKENRVNGNILLPFEWGEYAIWKLFPDCKVSIDGRFRTVYQENILDDHLQKLNDGSQFMEVLDKYPTDILLVPRRPYFEDLISSNEEWVYVYSDQTSFIFFRKSVKMRQLIEKIQRKEIIYPNQEISIYFP